MYVVALLVCTGFIQHMLFDEEVVLICRVHSSIECWCLRALFCLFCWVYIL